MNWKMFALVCTMSAAVALAADEIAEKYPVAENVRGHENTEWSISYACHYQDAGYELIASQVVEKVTEKLPLADVQATRGLMAIFRRGPKSMHCA